MPTAARRAAEAASEAAATAAALAEAEAQDESSKIPKSLVDRMLSTKLQALSSTPNEAPMLDADLSSAMQYATQAFISLVGGVAADLCEDAKRLTLTADDVLEALDVLDMSDFASREWNGGMRQVLERMLAAYRKEQEGKPKSRRGAKRGASGASPDTEEAKKPKLEGEAGGASANGGPSPGERDDGEL